MQKSLQELLYKVPLLATVGTTDHAVSGIYFDSRAVQPGSLFVATTGTQTDGHQFIDKAVAAGATVVVCKHLPENTETETTYIQVADTDEVLGQLASNFYNNPSAKLKVVGVTGTNGKTTTVTLLHQLFRRLGYNTGLISTVQYQINETILPSTHTTPDAVKLNALMAEMVEKGCTHCFMEVSSHSVVQRRIAGLQFTGAVFTNITHDHLDYHKTFDAYIKAKKKFFDDLPKTAFALSNIDDKRGKVMLQNTLASKNFYSLQTIAQFKAKLIANSLHGLHLDIENKDVWFKLIGNFNAYNILAAYGVGTLLGEDKEELLTQLSNLESAAGRFERWVSANKVTAIVDYAHTPDALQNVLDTINELRTGTEQVITVVGCGGNRDKAKRPVMAEVAARLSTQLILTADNPRDEEPETILAEMQAGLPLAKKQKVKTIIDRRQAIMAACQMAQPNDIILIAGKGHETYQEIKGMKHPFDDRVVVRECFETLKPTSK